MTSLLLVSALLLSIFSLPAVASVAFCRNQDYEWGKLGLAPLQTYNAAPFSPPQINYVIPPTDCPSNGQVEGYFFLAQLAGDSLETVFGGANILNPDGTLVYSAFPDSPNEITFRLGIQKFRGKDHLVIWRGSIKQNDYGSGFNLVLDDTYTVVANITVAPELHVGADIHELQITINDTAIMTAYPTKAANLSSFGGPKNGFLLDGVAQEVDIATGEAVFTWHALDQVDPSECFSEIGQDGDGTADKPWDFFHINAIQKLDDGNYFISARHCHTLYLVNPSGEIIWRMGGKKSDFTFGPGATFSWQHHGRMHDDRTFSVFNNGASPWDQNFPFSQGLLLDYDEKLMTISLINARSPFNRTLTTSQGSLQILDNRDSIVGWGAEPYYSQHDQNGKLVWSAQFSVQGSGYRVILHDWVGHPTFPPSAQLSNTSTINNVTVYAWWNGATEVKSWQLFGTKLASAIPLNTTDLRSSIPGAVKLGDPISKFDFEMTLHYDGRQGHFELYQVAALGKSGDILGYSEITSLGSSAQY
ncbi:hypothetical protein D9757_007453 [Collybiopsis confluens]|uniref:ASST-domain-containing protein n=1 Tax=Collybiopsis confluens TaxID=2823264 RepID=A0A8H5HJD7_9AGAR|nr:hypothetical protein D9757_007453 [Collybiopsis confluens]